jgi:outer membrane protein
MKADRSKRFESINRVLFALAAAALLGWGLGAKNEIPKLGVVDFEQAVTSTNEGRTVREELARKAREAESALMPLMESYQEIIKEFESKKFVLSDEARFQKQLDMAELQNRIENKRKEAQGQFKVDQERLIAPLRAKFQDVVESFGREEGFSLILHRGAPGIMYAKEALDITDRIIEKFNKRG